MAKNMIDELMGYRVKLEKDGREILNIPGILALPGALMAPKASIIGTVAASLLGCNIHMENEDGKAFDVGEKVRKAADSVMDTAKTAARTVREEMDKAWADLSSDDPEGCPEGEENEEETAGEANGGECAENTAEDATDGESAEDSAGEVTDEESAKKKAEDIVADLEKHAADDIPTIEVKPDDSTQA